MKENIEKLYERTIYSLENTNLELISKELKSITGSTIVTGVGGSSVVSNFVSKVLSKKNNIICNSMSSRNPLYLNIEPYKNIIACSYSGNNLGVNISLANSLNRYLLSHNRREDVNNLQYKINEKEHSFISLSSTIIPMSILLAYYLDKDISIIKEVLRDKESPSIKNSDIYELLSGYETNTADTFFSSTMTEAGLGVPIIHDKYDFCHGRSTLGIHYNTNMILLNNNTELDRLLLEELPKYYKNLLIINRKYTDNIINDYYLTYKLLLLCQNIALQKNKDLSDVEHSPITKKLYKFSGTM